MIPAGTWVTVTLAGEVNGILTSTTLAGAVQNGLAALGFQVGNFKIDDGGIFQNLVSLRWTHYLYSASVTVKAGADYNAADDIGAIVANQFYAQTGVLPTYQASATPDAFLTAPASGGAADALIGSGGTANVGSFLSGVFDNAKAGLAAVNSDAQLVTVGVFILAGVLVYFVLQGKNTGRILAAVKP